MTEDKETCSSFPWNHFVNRDGGEQVEEKNQDQRTFVYSFILSTIDTLLFCHSQVGPLFIDSSQCLSVSKFTMDMLIIFGYLLCSKSGNMYTTAYFTFIALQHYGWFFCVNEDSSSFKRISQIKLKKTSIQITVYLKVCV